MMIPTRLNPAIDLIFLLLQDAAFPWAITGSLGLALQGVPVDSVRDIDLTANRADIERLAGLLAAYEVEPAHWRVSERVRSVFGVLQIAGVPVEIMGGCEFALPGDGWTHADPLEWNIRWTEYRGMRLPVLDLAREARTYERMGSTEKAALLRAWLEDPTHAA